ncbi:peptidase S16 [Candidatus Poribacteria bacterium]|nr:peptidase S16 [Candidatus Poribacteria bacterium]
MTDDHADTVTMRLFPLRMVLFPRMTIPLHVFEERYRLMIGECIEQEAPFGVVLIERGREVGGTASVYGVGTTARITHVERFPDGKMDILAVGEHRFQLTSFFQHEPYPAGRVRIVPLPKTTLDDAELTPLVSSVRDSYARYSRLMGELEDSWEPSDALPKTPVELAYEIAATSALSETAKQRLLSESDLGALLRTEQEMIDRQNYENSALLAARRGISQRERRFGKMKSPFRLN